MSDMTPLQKRCIQLKAVQHIIDEAAEGKVVQTNVASEWRDRSDALDFTLPPVCYRIKPAPQYRPFTPAEALEHCGRSFKSSGSASPNYLYGISAVTPWGVRVRKAGEGLQTEHGWSFDDLLRLGTWASDGTRCGVLEP